MAIYLEYEGLKGNVTADGFQDCMKINSLGFGISRNISMDPGKMANREVGRPTISVVTLSRDVDSCTPAMFKESCSGSSGSQATFKFVHTGSAKIEAYMEYTLYDCLVSNYAVSADGDAEPTEDISLSFSKCEINYKDHDATNKTGSPQRAGYDLAKASPL